MTTLGKLKTLKDNEIQKWLTRVGEEKVKLLVVALLGADEEVRNCVFRNMTEKASSLMKEDLIKYKNMHIQEMTIRKNSMDLERLM